MRNGKAIRADQRKRRGTDMKNLIATLRANAAKRAQYRQMRDEIANMPRHVALDIGIYPEDAARIAAKAVWG